MAGENEEKKMRKYLQGFFALALAIFFVLPILGCKDTDGKAKPQETRLLCSNTPPIVAGDTVALFAESEVSGNGECVIELQPEGSNIIVASQGAYNFVVHPKVAGTYRFRFSVVDGNKSGSDTTEFEVVPLTIGNCVANVSVGTISVSSNAGMKQGTQYRFYWAQDNPPVVYSWQDAAIFNCEFVAGKTYWMQAEVDNGGIVKSNNLTSFTVPVTPTTPPSGATEWCPGVTEFSDRYEAGMEVTVWKNTGIIEFHNAINYFYPDGQAAIPEGKFFSAGDRPGWEYSPDKAALAYSGGTVSISFAGFPVGQHRIAVGLRNKDNTESYFIIKDLMSTASQRALYRATQGGGEGSFAIQVKSDGTITLIPEGTAVPVWNP